MLHSIFDAICCQRTKTKQPNNNKKPATTAQKYGVVSYVSITQKHQLQKSNLVFVTKTVNTEAHTNEHNMHACMYTQDELVVSWILTFH